MQQNSKIYIAGHRGLVGSAIQKSLQNKGYKNIITKTHKELDLTNQAETNKFFRKEMPEYIFLAAAKVGGIIANNTYRAEFIYENLMIQNNIINAAHQTKAKKLLFLGSSCIYPKECAQPMQENSLLTSPLEHTNEPYAIAKIAGLKMIESYNLQYGTNFIATMPTNLFGYNDNYDLQNSHVLPALIRKMHLGKALKEENYDLILNDLKTYPINKKLINKNQSQQEIKNILANHGIKKTNREVTITLWGTGTPKREFLFAEDLGDACVFLMKNIDFKQIIQNITPQHEIKNTHINIGTGKDISIRELAEKIQKTIGFNGHIHWDKNKPDGTMRKLLDTKKINELGWKPKTEMKEAIEKVYNHYIKTLKETKQLSTTL